MAKLPQIIVDPVLNIGLFWGVGAPPSDFLPGESSGWRNMSTGDVYTLNGSNAWVQLGTAGATSWASLTGVPNTVAGYGITNVYTKTAGDARYVLKAGDTMTGDLNGTRLTLHDNLLYESYTNGVANLAINYLGYAGGTSQFRDFGVYDGKSSNILYITGATKAAVFSGGLTVSGTGGLTVSHDLSVSGLATVGQLLANGAAAQIIAQNSSSTSYATIRLYNDLNINVHALEIDYSGSAWSGQLVTGGPVGESAAIYTTGAFPLSFGTNTTERLRLGANGGVLAYGPANITALQAFGSSTTGQSYGLYVQAGTNSSDISILVKNQAGTTLFQVRGDGASFFTDDVTAADFVLA